MPVRDAIASYQGGSRMKEGTPMTTIRNAAAGTFYPGDCAAQIEAFISSFNPPANLPEKLVGAALPHAGWTYSGAVAARTLYTLSRHISPETCIFFGADHIGLKQHTLYPEGAWATPLGELNIDEALSTAILNKLPDMVIADPSAHIHEHAIEVICPMLKYFWPELQLVPITVTTSHTAGTIGKTIGELVLNSERHAIFLGSSDLTHYGPMFGFAPHGDGHEALVWMKKNDRSMIGRLEKLEQNEILTEALSHRNACGSGALTALLAAVTTLGAKHGYLIEYKTSFDSESGAYFTSGVGYAGIVF